MKKILLFMFLFPFSVWAQLTISPTPVSDSINLDSTSSTIYFSNTTTTPIVMTLTMSQPGFSMGVNRCAQKTLQKSQNCYIVVSVNDTTLALGVNTAMVKNSGVDLVSLKRTKIQGIGASVFTTTTATFNDFIAKTISIQNKTISAQTYSPVLIGTDASKFEIVLNRCQNVSSGAFCTVQLRLKPQMVGVYSAILSDAIVSNSIALSGIVAGSTSGTTQAPVEGITVFPASFDFGNLSNIGLSANKIFTITNTGNTIISPIISVPAPLVILLNRCSSLKPGLSCSVAVGYNLVLPQANGSRNFTISVQSSVSATASTLSVVANIQLANNGPVVCGGSTHSDNGSCVSNTHACTAPELLTAPHSVTGLANWIPSSSTYSCQALTCEMGYAVSSSGDCGLSQAPSFVSLPGSSIAPAGVPGNFTDKIYALGTNSYLMSTSSNTYLTGLFSTSIVGAGIFMEGSGDAYNPRVTLGNKTFVNAYNSSFIGGLYAYDSIAGNMSLIIDVPGSAQGPARRITKFKNNIYFFGPNSVSSSYLDLRKTDGITTSLVSVPSFYLSNYGIFANDDIMIVSSFATGTYYSKDGTNFILMGNANGIKSSQGAMAIVEHNGQLYYVQGNQLYKFDIASATSTAIHTFTGINGYFTIIKGDTKLFVMAENSGKFDLFTVDLATDVVILATSAAGKWDHYSSYSLDNRKNQNSNQGNKYAIVGDKLFFSAPTGGDIYSFKLWRSDGTPSGTFTISSELFVIKDFGTTQMGTVLFETAFQGTLSSCNKIYGLNPYDDTIFQVTSFPGGVNDSGCSSSDRFGVLNDNLPRFFNNGIIYNFNF